MIQMWCDRCGVEMAGHSHSIATDKYRIHISFWSPNDSGPMRDYHFCNPCKVALVKELDMEGPNDWPDTLTDRGGDNDKKPFVWKGGQ